MAEHHCLYCEQKKKRDVSEQVGRPLANAHHVQLLPERADGPLLAGDQLLQVLVAQLLPGAALPGALATSLQFGLQVDLGRLAAALAGLLGFARRQHLRTTAAARPR